MTRHKKVTALAALTAAAALVLTGCSSGNNNNGGGGDDGGDRGEVVFVDAVGTNPPHLNMMLSTDVTTTLVSSSMFETLITLDAEYNLYPSLATEWEVSDDGLEYTFKLRDDVKWHDGEPFTSADVKFNLEEVLKLHPLGATLASAQEKVEAPDDHTVVVTLKEPFAPYLQGLTSKVMLPEHLYAGTDIPTNPVNSAPVGTGPFKFSEFVEGSHVQVVKNDDYWGEKTDIDKVIFQIMPDANARVLALRSGEVDRIAATFLDAAQVSTLRQDSNLMLSRSTSLPSTMTLFFNSQNGPTADPAVRKALYRAIDRQAIADNVYYGMATPSRGPIPAAIQWAVDPSIDFNKQFAFDQAKAAAELDAAGYPVGADGKRFELNIRVASGLPTFVATTEVVKSSLEEIGVSVNIIAEDLNVFVDKVYTQHDFDMAVMSFGAYEDPNLGVSRLYVCNPESRAFRNPTLMCDSELDTAFADAARVSDLGDRRSHFADAERRVAELMHTVPLVDDESESVVRTDRWKNVDKFVGTVFLYNWSALRAG